MKFVLLPLALIFLFVLPFVAVKKPFNPGRIYWSFHNLFVGTLFFQRLDAIGGWGSACWVACTFLLDKG